MRNLQGTSERAVSLPLRQRLRRPVAALVGVAGLLAGCDVFADSTPSVSSGKYHNVGDLRAAGACADELFAEQKLYVAQADRANNHDYKKSMQGTAEGFAVAGRLAAAHSVSCYPKNPSAHNLTPDFDVNELKKDKECADEILSGNIDPAQANNSENRDRIELNNIENGLLASLATKYGIPCE